MEKKGGGGKSREVGILAKSLIIRRFEIVASHFSDVAVVFLPTLSSLHTSRTLCSRSSTHNKVEG